jgi:redox-sensitive bicupin YhaK (pirin superfamily)
MSAQIMKKKLEIITPPGRHWVGDGFYVHGMFGYGRGAVSRSPFLMMDYGQEEYFKPNPGRPRGVGTHPHKGFETVTIAYQGEVEHQDSNGGGGIIGPGDCQWMTAGRGIQHSEFHSKEFSKNGGNFEMMQLWVNLPKRFKEVPPKYQAITAASMAQVTLPEEAGHVTLIAGELNGTKGPASTHTPMNVWNLYLNGGGIADLPQKEGWTTIIAVLSGNITVNGIDVNTHQLIHLSNEGTGVRIEAKDKSKVLFLAGEPFDEPVVGHGPFVMNTQEEIRQAFNDFYSGKF